jgi:hypothetical protein
VFALCSGKALAFVLAPHTRAKVNKAACKNKLNLLRINILFLYIDTH